MKQINWEQQWALHGHNFFEGHVHCTLADREKAILLKPGPGFGDLSHPTTRLVIQLMKNMIKEKRVLDVGCGSGILSLVASAMGAVVQGIDIDEDAVEHAKINASINDMSNIQFFSTQNFVPRLFKPDYILMNMIRSEQKVAYNNLSTYSSYHIITSGILKEERLLYLSECLTRNWHLIEEIEEEGWMAFHFTKEG